MKNKKRCFFGEGKLEKIREIFLSNSIRKILIISGRNILNNSSIRTQLERLLKNKKIYFYASEASNPEKREIEGIISLCHKKDINAIVAIGGGKVIDLAKITRVSLFEDLDMILHNPKLINANKIPLVAIPTTAGTGSESTHFAVLYIDGIKHSVANKHIKPDFAIIDPNLTFSAPEIVKISSGLDALCQSIESFWSVKANSLSQRYAKKSIQIILPNIYNAVKEKRKEALIRMCLGSYFSGKAINISKTTGAHALSYPISSELKIPHGYAVSLTISAFLMYNDTKNKPDISPFIEPSTHANNMKTLLGLFGCKTTSECVVYWHNLMKSLGLESSLAKLTVDKKILNKIINNVNNERLLNNPVIFKKANFRKILAELE